MSLCSPFRIKWRCLSCRKFWHKAYVSWISARITGSKMLKLMKPGITWNIRVHRLSPSLYTDCRNAIATAYRSAQLVANPGCYPTSAILAAMPFREIWGRGIRFNYRRFKVGHFGAVRNRVKTRTMPIESRILRLTISVSIGIHPRLSRS